MAVFRGLQQTRGGARAQGVYRGGNQHNTHFSACLHLRRLTGRSFMGVMGSGRSGTK